MWANRATSTRARRPRIVAARRDRGPVGGTPAKPVTAPPSPIHRPQPSICTSLPRTRASAFRPGQRVGVRLALRGEESTLVVPRAALLHDAYGGTWVYEAREARVFVRRRVSVVDLVDDSRGARPGPAPGHASRDGRRRGALRHRVRCRQVMQRRADRWSGQPDARADRAGAAASRAGRGALGRPDRRRHQDGARARRSTSSRSSRRRSSRSRPRPPASRAPTSRRSISVPLEAAMNGVPGLKTLRSKSVLGLSSVVLIFDDGTDRIAARQLVQERLARVAATLPAAAHPPVILSPLSSLSRVMKIGMSSKTLSQVELTTLAQVDGASAADGDSRRRERRDLGPARSPACRCSSIPSGCAPAA